MHFKIATILSILYASIAIAGSVRPRDDANDPNINIFKNSNKLWEGAICEDQITKAKYNLALPQNVDGGCVRYYQGIDMSGDVTELDLFIKDGIHSACDCIAQCIKHIDTCTNWVFKHEFSDFDEGKRSCALYSSPNLPTKVTLKYDTASSTNFATLLANPQLGGPAPFTFEDAKNTMKDPFGVSGFIAQDGDNKIYC